MIKRWLVHDNASMSQILIKSTESPTFKANVLPCKVRFSGMRDASQYWKIERGEDDQVAYFRGRKLRSVEKNEVKGFLLKKEENNAECYESIGVVEEMSNWGHEKVHSNSDGLEKIEEWISVSSAMHR